MTDQNVGHDDFLTYWDMRRADRASHTVRILGVDIVVPTELPLRIQQHLQEIGETESLDDLRAALADVFGVDPLDAWIDAGATSEMLKVILAWGIANAQGTPTSFERAAELAAEADAAAAGKAVAPNRAVRRASSATARSGKAGRSSSPTSAASTGSRRKK